MLSQYQVIETSVIALDGTEYALTPDKKLLVKGDTAGFIGQMVGEALLCERTPENAVLLRTRLPWLNPVTLGLHTSAGFGDRLGIATPGHVQATIGTGVAPIFAQQSVRENSRTHRTPQNVVDDAMWGVFEMGWREAWGADADHLKHAADVAAFVKAGYTFFTIDPGDHVDDAAETDSLDILHTKAAALPWDVLQTTLVEMQTRYQTLFNLGALTLTFDERDVLKAAVKYGSAVAHTLRMAEELKTQSQGRPFEIEMSVDETGTTTSWHEHLYIASELIRNGIPFVSLAPRFVGRFEKGVDYIGDLDELEENIVGHAAIMRHFGNLYKLSLHTGSDKFGVYPIAMRHTEGRVHLKTAGTSYLEALRVMAAVNVGFFRQILTFARERYETDRKTYHVSATLDNVPESAHLTDEQLPALLDQFDARQVLHVTFGSVLDSFGEKLHRLLRANEPLYHGYLKRHFDRHLAAFRQESR